MESNFTENGNAERGRNNHEVTPTERAALNRAELTEAQQAALSDAELAVINPYNLSEDQRRRQALNKGGIHSLAGVINRAVYYLELAATRAGKTPAQLSAEQWDWLAKQAADALVVLNAAIEDRKANPNKQVLPPSRKPGSARKRGNPIPDKIGTAPSFEGAGEPAEVVAIANGKGKHNGGKGKSA